MAKFTQKAIMVSFLELLKTKSLDKVTVKDIVETCEINRNTFYYYYSDIYELLEDVFHAETEKVMKEANQDATFCEEYIKAANIILRYKEAIKHIYHSKSKDVLENYLVNVTNDLVRRFVEKAAQGHNISEENIEYICKFYGYAIVGSTLNWIHEGMPPYRVDLIKKISESFEVTIGDMIRHYSQFFRQILRGV